MQKRHPARDGAVLLGCEHVSLNQKRPVLQANAAMRLRLGALLWAMRWEAVR